MSHTVFFICFSVYIAALIGVGLAVSRRQKSGDDFLLAGRKLPLLLILGTTVATMVGTGSSMGAVGFGYANGWAGGLYGIGGALGILLLGWWFAPVRNLHFTTMSEELAYYVGNKTIVKNTVGCLIFLACIGWLGAHILGGGMYLAWITGIGEPWAKIIVALGFTVYIVIGGYTAVVWTDTIQAVVLFLGFILMVVCALDKVGGWTTLMQAQPESHLSFISIGGLPALSLIAVIAVGVLATPSFRQRIYSADSVKSVRTSFTCSGILYLLFSFIPAVIGMAAFALNSELDNRNYAFPFLAIEVLPLGVGIIVLIAGLSATMSSASSDAIAGVAILLRDIYLMIFGKLPAETNMISLSRISVVIVVGSALLLSLLSSDIISYITNMIATVMSGMFACGMLGRFWSRFTWQGAMAALFGGSLTSLVILFSPTLLAMLGNPILPATTAAFIGGVAMSFFSTRNSVLATVTD